MRSRKNCNDDGKEMSAWRIGWRLVLVGGMVLRHVFLHNMLVLDFWRLSFGKEEEEDG